MRILMCAWRDLRHPASGGAEVWTHEVCARLAGAGHDVVLFSAAAEGAPERELMPSPAGSYEIVRDGGQLGVYLSARRYWRSEQARLGRVPFEVVIDQMNTVPFLAHRWAHGARVLGMAHQLCREVWWYEAPLHQAAVGRFIVEPLALRAMRRVPTITVSESSGESLRDAGFGDVRVLPQGGNLPTLATRPAKAEVPTVVFCARLVRSKRPDHAAQAFVDAKRSGSLDPDAQLWIVGDGPMRDSLRRFAQYGVELCGRVDETEKLERMAAAWALVATSVREGWGLIVSEAASVGTPSIGYRVPGLVDSVTAADGILVDPNPKALAVELGRSLPVLRDRTPASTGVAPWEAVADAVAASVEDILTAL